MTRSLTVERIVPGAPARVWQAWTTAEGLAGWWWKHLPGATYEIDARVGGTDRIGSRLAGIGVHGQYTEVDEPNRFAATWIWVDEGKDGDLEYIAVSFAVHPGGTMVTIVHEGAWATDEPMESYRQGWNDTLDSLAKLPT